MNLYAKLTERAAQGKPLRVGLIGAGKFGTMYLAQIPKTPGVHLAGIADLSPANVRARSAVTVPVPAPNRTALPEVSIEVTFVRSNIATPASAQARDSSNASVPGRSSSWW